MAMTDKALTIDTKLKAPKLPIPPQAGAVKITLHSANSEIDEKAELRVALSNPEDAVEKMLQTLAQRFPPESVMTIAPTKGVDQSGSSSEGPTSGSPNGSRSVSSSDSSRRRAAGQILTVPNPDAVRASIQSGAYVSLPPEIRQGLATLPSEYTTWILANDPAIMPDLLNLATRGGDPKAWATQLGLDPAAVSNIVNALRNDPNFYRWVSKLASAALSPQSAEGKKKRRHKGGKHQSVPTPQDSKGYSHTYSHPADRMQPPYSPMAHPEYYQPGYPGVHPYPGMPHPGMPPTDNQQMHPTPPHMPGYHHPGWPGMPYPPLYPQLPNQPQGQMPPPGAPLAPGTDRRSPSGDGQTQPTPGSRPSVDARQPADQRYPFDQAGPGETIEILPDGTRVRYVETPVIEEQIIEVPRKEVVEIEKRVPKQVIQEIEKVVEKPEIRYVERPVEVEKVEEVIRHVPKKEFVDVNVEKTIEVKVPQTVVKEKIIEIPQVIERPRPYTVEQKVPVARYVNRETQTVVAQKLRPVVRQGKKQKVAAKKYEPVLYAVDVPIPKPVHCGFMPLGKVDEFHSIVEIPAPQYNSLLQAMNRQIEAAAIEDLFVRTVGGVIPLLPVGELTEVVPPVNPVPTATAGRPSYKTKKRSHRDTRSPSRKHHHRH
eukprot:Protomagalhaensia_sp_Gyna_25__259@NODE_1122_length_2166_cov_48_531265_g891_i0_p1_GENE_NODE_1122_length_2166_cov_48_531265_g891_i0NODE_1122_length_2166_cov_48_531265_g891_i0_p1_ORF_typecomplete_len654_score137_52IMCp/PF12314_8/14IMCp/PF12314_8/2e05IMCp/PF12314_8/68IMCp/PF12314_8/4_6e03Cro/PF09048_10/1_2e02Cro/PF09048_10/1_8DbpA/PF03880_15/1_7e02DbpA/PF03880_15/3_4_NODE_1122_length_2166_cov_48_531265_g891_i01882149